MSKKILNILLADDDIDDQTFFKNALDAIPLETHLSTVADGQQLITYLTDNIDRLPHVLFLDINMPGKNGHECLAEIKKNEKMKDLPVVMYSTSKEKDKIDILFNVGADVYVHKPSRFSELIQVIYHALPLAAENIFSNGKIKYILNA